MKCAIFATEDEALKVCQRIDTSLGYPRTEQGEIGPPVVTERWALPIEMADGTYAVPMLDEHAKIARVPKGSISHSAADISARRKPEPDAMPAKRKKGSNV